VKKPTVLVTLLTGLERQHWINPDLMLNLLTMTKDARFDVSFAPIRDARPWDAARNVAMAAAQYADVDWLISFDNDNFVPGNPLDILAQATPDQSVIGLRYGVAQGSGYSLFPEVKRKGPFVEVDAVAGGVLMVHRKVWDTIPEPWFRWQYGNNPLNPADGTAGEDVSFCRLVRQHGFKVWTHATALAGHYRTTDLTRMVAA
jgi:hypothetical protein